jgi:hypothetical protein
MRAQLLQMGFGDPLVCLADSISRPNFMVSPSSAGFWSLMSRPIPSAVPPALRGG